MFFKKKINKKEIKLVFNKGYIYKKKKFCIRFLKKKKINKILIIVPKKFIKKAVNRNKIKRLIYNSYLMNKYILYNFYYIIFIYKTYKMYNFNYLNKKILIFFKKKLI
ncbi:MAG: ribonuclease P protein component [Candidatus Shikimatogenerans bostrichidophilus]|nr:MAG: ribonuclease P protein component [Candidatus Shikimatogenerans bostrichidophilus]